MINFRDKKGYFLEFPDILPFTERHYICMTFRDLIYLMKVSIKNTSETINILYNLTKPYKWRLECV